MGREQFVQKVINVRVEVNFSHSKNRKASLAAGLSRLGGSVQPPAIQCPHPTKSNPCDDILI